MDVAMSAVTALSMAASSDAAAGRPTAYQPSAELAAATGTEVSAAPPGGGSLSESLNQAAKLTSTALEFTVDETTNTQVVVVRDSASGDVILQYPSEDALRMIRNLESGVGGLVDKLI